MSPFIETIKVENGEARNLRFHQARFNRTRFEKLGLESHPALADEIIIPPSARDGLFKCRLIYDQKISRVEFSPYVRPDIRTLKLISDDQITYDYKSADRSALRALYDLRGSCDDILILKKGWISDSYFANVVMWDGSRWYTPESPLLEGTMRAFLLESGAIKRADIRIEDLSKFSKLRLINALNDLYDSPLIPIEALSW